jgi:predicted HicB family RNase H-like nuclease
MSLEVDYAEDTRGTVQVDITDDQFLILAKMAHEQDITLNTLVNNILRERMTEELKDIQDNPQQE